MLPPRRAAFVREYLLDHNAAQATIRAGYSSKGAAQAGERLLRDPEVRAAIAAKERVVGEKLDISLERIERTLAALAFGDATKLFKPGGVPLEPQEIPEELRPLFAGYEIDPSSETKGERRILRVRNEAAQLKALEMLTRRHAVFRTSTDLNVTGIAAMTPAQKAARLSALVAKGKGKR